MISFETIWCNAIMIYIPAQLKLAIQLSLKCLRYHRDTLRRSGKYCTGSLSSAIDSSSRITLQKLTISEIDFHEHQVTVESLL